MPCTKCKADFNLLTWKMKCVDCEQSHCSKCLKKAYGAMYCEKCVILNKRPPDRTRLMELRAKDLRDYLNKNKVSTHGLVEKEEFVELLCRCPIPVRRKHSKGLSSVLTGSVPNLASQSQDRINNLRTNIGSNINNMRSYAENALYNFGSRIAPTNNSHPADSPHMATFAQQSHTFFNSQSPVGQQNYSYTYSQHHSPADVPPQPASSSSHDATNSSTSLPKHLKLIDFETAEELSELSIKQLKELLTLNRVDYKGCIEKTELLDRAIRLWNDRNQHRSEDFDDVGVDNLCKICMDAPLDCVLLECGHMATCVDCGKRLAECPICRQYVTRVVKTFKA